MIGCLTGGDDNDQCVLPVSIFLDPIKLTRNQASSHYQSSFISHISRTDNELDDDIEDDGEMCSDISKILRRIYNREANCANLRKRGQENLVYILTDAAKCDDFIQFVQNPTPSSKWDTFVRKTPPEKISKGRKKSNNSPKKPKKKEGYKPSKNTKEDDSQDCNGIAGNASHMKSTISKKRSKEGKKQATASAKAGKDHKKKGKKSKANAMDGILVILVKFDIYSTNCKNNVEQLIQREKSENHARHIHCHWYSHHPDQCIQIRIVGVPI